MSCQLCVDGAVRPPVFWRVTPNAAHSKSESAWTGNFSVLNSLMDLRAYRACINGIPVFTWAVEI
jgi:hypothetical protein